MQRKNDRSVSLILSFPADLLRKWRMNHSRYRTAVAAAAYVCLGRFFLYSGSLIGKRVQDYMLMQHGCDVISLELAVTKFNFGIGTFVRSLQRGIVVLLVHDLILLIKPWLHYHNKSALRPVKTCVRRRRTVCQLITVKLHLALRESKQS